MNVAGEIVPAIEAALLVEAAKSAIGQIVAPVISRLFRLRFAGVEAPDVRTAVERLRPFMGELDARLGAAAALHDKRLERLIERPEITGSLSAAFETAMETDDALKRSVLADLLIERLRAPEESTDGHAMRNAIESIRDLSPHHLRILGLTHFLNCDRAIRTAHARTVYEQQALADFEHSQGDLFGHDEEARLRLSYRMWLVEHAIILLESVTSGDCNHLCALGLMALGSGADESTFLLSQPNPTMLGLSLKPDFARLKEIIRSATQYETVHCIGAWVLPLAEASLSPAGAVIGRDVRTQLALPVSYNWQSNQLVVRLPSAWQIIEDTAMSVETEFCVDNAVPGEQLESWRGDSG